MALPYSETWTGSNGASWSGDWTVSTSSGGTVDIQSNAGRMLTGSLGGYADYCRALLADQAEADFDLTVDLIPQVQDEHYPVLSFRTDRTWSTGSSGPCWATNGYGVEIQIDSDGTGYWNIDRVDAGSRTDIATDTYSASSGDTIHLNVRCEGTAVEFRIWKNAESKPGTATASFTDSTHNARTGHGLAMNGGAGTLDEDRWDNLAIDPIGADLTLNPTSDVTVTGWATQTGATSNLYQAIDEDSASDSDYVASEPASTAALEVGLQSGTDPTMSSGHVVHYRYRKQGTPAADLTVSLRQGAGTEIASWAHTGISTTWATADQTLTGTQADSITDYTTLRLRFAPTTATSAVSKVSDRGSTQNLTSQGSTTVSLTGNTTVGNVMIARVAVDNSGTNGARPGLTVTDDRSNTWTVVQGGLADPGAANAGSAVYVAYCRVDTQLVTSDLVTFTWGTAAAAKAIVLEEWSGVHAITPVPSGISPVTASGSTGTMSVGPIAPAAADQMVYTALSTEGPTGDTAPSDSDTTNGSWVSLTRLSTTSGTAAANQTVAGQYKLVTASGNQTWNATITSRDWAAVAVVFHGGSTAQVSWANLELPEASVEGTATGTFTFAGPASGVPTTFGTAATALTFTGPSSATVTVSATAATALVFSGPASGSTSAPEVTGTADGAFSFSGPASGVPTTLGTAATSLSFTGPAVGLRTVAATAAGSFTFTGAASGGVVVGGNAPVLYSDATAFLYSDATQVYYLTTEATTDLEFAGPAVGTVTRSGQAATALTFDGPAVGTVTAEEITGTAATALSFAAPASGTPTVHATAATALAFAAPAVGSVEAEEVTGTGATDLVFAAPASAAVTHLGTAATTFAFAGLATATVTHPGTAAGSFTFTAPAAGSTTVLATAATALSFAGPASGAVTVTATAATSLTFDAPASGASYAPGAGVAATALMFAAPAVGTRTTAGTAASNFTYTAPAVGTPTTLGTAATALTFAGPSSATVTHPGNAVTNLVFAAPATGEGAAAATGTAATNLTFTAPAAGSVDHLGAAVAALTFAATAAATVTHPATAATALQFAAAAAGTVVGIVTGTAATTITFAGPIQVGVPIILAERTSARRPANQTSTRRQMSTVA